MNYKPKCLICKCRKWFNCGKFCRQCLKENDECIAGEHTVSVGGKEIGTCSYFTVNKTEPYAEVRSSKYKNMTKEETKKFLSEIQERLNSDDIVN